MKIRTIVALLGCALVTASCAGSSEPATEAASLEVHDAWAKAAESGMTAAFAHLHNTSDRELHIVSATTPAAQRVELHEVVPGAAGAMTMQPKEGGFVVAPHGDLELQPGADHLMLMDLTSPLAVGSDVQIVATFADGSTVPITAQVRDFPGADEQYSTDSHG